MTIAILQNMVALKYTFEYMHENTDSQIATSLEVQSDLLPFLPDLVIDLWALGSSPGEIVELVRQLALPAETTKVLDLGCGKGAVSIALAREFGFQVLGIDAFQPFLRDAQQKAQEHKVAPLCRFMVANIHDIIDTARDFDIVIYAALGNVLGSFDECVAKLRQTIHPGGYMIIDDGFLKRSKKFLHPGYEHYGSYETTRQWLTAHGDTIVTEVILPDEVTTSVNDEYLHAIQGRAQDLISAHPELETLINEYVANQIEECKIINEELTGAIWLLQGIYSELA
jgi:2-polyprenyl-3-methyl-5-hydroxy-6-metoxy-1,4-benzoquinol methylase